MSCSPHLRQACRSYKTPVSGRRKGFAYAPTVFGLRLRVLFVQESRPSGMLETLRCDSLGLKRQHARKYHRATARQQ